jgi:hypothetical protein
MHVTGHQTRGMCAADGSKEGRVRPHGTLHSLHSLQAYNTAFTAFGQLQAATTICLRTAAKRRSGSESEDETEEDEDEDEDA